MGLLYVFFLPWGLCGILQTEAGRSSRPGRYNKTQSGAAEEGWRGTWCHLPHLPQDKVCRWHRAYLSLLQHTMLCQMWWKSHPSEYQGKLLYPVFTKTLMHRSLSQKKYAFYSSKMIMKKVLPGRKNAIWGLYLGYSHFVTFLGEKLFYIFLIITKAEGRKCLFFRFFTVFCCIMQQWEGYVEEKEMRCWYYCVWFLQPNEGRD